MGADEPLEGAGTNQGHVAGQHHEGPRPALEQRLRLQQRVPGAALLVLAGEGQRRAVGEGGPHPLPLMADHEADALGAQGVGGARDVLDQGQAGEAVQHLGPGGSHAGAAAGGKDDDVVRHRPPSVIEPGGPW